MKTLIIYSTNHGSTADAARRIKEKIGSDAIAVDVKEDPTHDLAPYDEVIIGGSIHAGSIQRTIRKFCKANESVLLRKRLGLFISCMYEGDRAREQFERAFPKALREHSIAHGYFGGVLDFEKMNFVERAIVRKVEGVTETVRKIDHAAMDAFAEKMSRR
jgi:menaquinone-dependent protoporphyrinogen oxidase